MSKLPIPPIPDLARVRGETVNEAISWLKAYYESEGAFFNYLCATRAVKQAYKGFDSIKQLLAASETEKTQQGKKSNKEVIEYAAPLAFGRNMHVVDLPRRQFAFGRDRYSAYRIPFFFVENGIVHIYYLQPRKGYVLTHDQMCMVATIHKRYLLDTEFFGQATDVEYVDLSALPGTKDRMLHQYKLDDLEPWSEKRLADRLTLISEALDYIEVQDIVRPRRRQPARISPDMPLF